MNNEFMFYSKTGCPDIICSAHLTMYDLLSQEKKRANASKDVVNTSINALNDNTIIYRAADIIKKEISAIPPTTEYPRACELDLDHSQKFVPQCLQIFLLWLFDNEAFVKCSNVFISTEIKRWVLSLCECIIYCARRGKKQVIPPFVLGLSLQIEHEYGSRGLIETLHSYGFCVLYDELRTFLTSAVINIQNDLSHGLLPNGIVGRQNDGLLIQEGNDNIDINTQTIDGKNTYHSMARVVFQDQHVNIDLENIMSPRIKRQQEKTLAGKSHFKSYSTTFLYDKPKIRPEPSRYNNACMQIENSMSHFEKCSAGKDITWLLLRNLSRHILQNDRDSSPVSDQKIPFWTGFHTKIAKPTL